MDQSKLEHLKGLLNNPVFIAATVSFIIAQILKALITLLTSKDKRYRDTLIALFWTTGGMPSSHAALVSALATSTGIHTGTSSTVFVISFFLALIVMRDALGVRRAAGMQAKALNTLIRELSTKLQCDSAPVKEIQGHTPLEVAMGALLGVFCACFVELIR